MRLVLLRALILNIITPMIPPPHRNLHAALTSRTNSKAWELSISKVLPEIGENWIRKYVLSLFFC